MVLLKNQSSLTNVFDKAITNEAGNGSKGCAYCCLLRTPKGTLKTCFIVFADSKPAVQLPAAAWKASFRALRTHIESYHCWFSVACGNTKHRILPSISGQAGNKVPICVGSCTRFLGLLHKYIADLTNKSRKKIYSRA